MPGPQGDPLTAARFSIVIDGVEIAAFNELVGLETEVEPAPVQTSGQLGTLKWPSVTLKRGMTGGLELFAWHQAARERNAASARKRATLIMFNTEHLAVARFEMTNAWPSKLSIGALKAGSSEILYETVTIVCESLDRVSPS